MIRSKKLRNSARDQDCTLMLDEICNGDSGTTVFAHFNDGYQGMGLKANDTSGCFACSSCHDVIDGRIKHSFEPGYLSERKFLANQATLHIWDGMGMLVVKGRAA